MAGNNSMKLLDNIREVVARESSRASAEPLRWRIHSAMSRLPDMEPNELGEMRWFEYEIDIYSNATADRESETLDWLRALDIAAAPEVAASIPFGDRSCVLVRRYWACPGERLLIPDPFDNAPRWPETARTRFRDDMAKLAAHGKVHPYARGYAHMYLSDRTGTILLNTWSVLTAGNEREQREFLASIDSQLARRT